MGIPIHTVIVRGETAAGILFEVTQIHTVTVHSETTMATLYTVTLIHMGTAHIETATAIQPAAILTAMATPLVAEQPNIAVKRDWLTAGFRPLPASPLPLR